MQNCFVTLPWRIQIEVLFFYQATIKVCAAFGKFMFWRKSVVTIYSLVHNSHRRSSCLTSRNCGIVAYQEILSGHLQKQAYLYTLWAQYEDCTGTLWKVCRAFEELAWVNVHTKNWSQVFPFKTVMQDMSLIVATHSRHPWCVTTLSWQNDCWQLQQLKHMVSFTISRHFLETWWMATGLTTPLFCIQAPYHLFIEVENRKWERKKRGTAHNSMDLQNA